MMKHETPRNRSMLVVVAAVVGGLHLFGVAQAAPVFPFVDCPRGLGQIDFAGPAPVENAVRELTPLFQAECPEYIVNVLLGGDSAAGARQVCSQFLEGMEQPVEVGGMIRDWDPDTDFVVWENDYTVDCGGSTREAVQLALAYDATTVGVVARSIAHACLDSLPTGTGLTLDQLRWMFSSYSDLELQTHGWDPASVPLSRSNTENRTWAELGGAACPDVNIELAGPTAAWDFYQLFAAVVFQGDDETFHERYMGENDLAQIEEQLDVGYEGAGIALFSLNYLLSRDLTLVPVAVQSPLTLEFVVPTYKTVSSSTYIPLSHPLYLNVLANSRVFDEVGPFLEASFSPAGDAALEAIGKVPLRDGDKYAARIKVESPFAPVADDIACGETVGTLRLAGTSAVASLAEIWAQVYRTHCGREHEIELSVSGSFEGAAAVCRAAAPDDNDDVVVHIALLSRALVSSEATSSNAWLYECTESAREIVEVNVAVDGQVFLVSDEGPAYECIQTLGGLTKEQLRWMFSNIAEEDLAAEIDLAAAIPNSDGNSTTHRWSELSMNPACVDAEIKLAAADLIDGGAHPLSEYLFTREGETFDFERLTESTGISYEQSTFQSTVVNYVISRNDSIGVVQFTNYPERGYDAYLVPVFNPNLGEDGEFIQPTLQTLQSGEYPFVERSRMALRNDPNSLELILPFIQFALSPVGQKLVGQVHSLGLSSTEATIMQTRAQTDLGVPFDEIREASHLGCASEGFSIAGSSTVFPIAELWSGVYEVGCGVDISVQGGGSSDGAGRVCGELKRGSPVDIGDMSREWKSSEGLPREDNPAIYDCQKGDLMRSAIQTRVAIDGLTVVTLKDGIAADCIEVLGGLTIDQLRWMYSDRSDEELLEDPDWDPRAVPNSDGSSFTHLWSELHEDCVRQEIQISGADAESGTYEYMLETIFSDHENGETFDLERPAPYVNNEVDEVLVQYLEENPAAISYFGYAYFFTRQDVLAPVAIRNSDGKFVLANVETMSDNSYNPLSRPIYMNLLNDPVVLAQTYPFIQFGFSNRGSDLVSETGYVVVDNQYKFNALNIIASAAGLPPPPNLTASPASAPTTSMPASNGNDGLSVGGIAGVCISATILVLCCVVGVIFLTSGGSDDTEETNDVEVGKQEEMAKQPKTAKEKAEDKLAAAAAKRDREREIVAKKARQAAAQCALEEAAAAQHAERERKQMEKVQCGTGEQAPVQKEVKAEKALVVVAEQQKLGEAHYATVASSVEEGETDELPTERVSDELLPDE